MTLKLKTEEQLIILTVAYKLSKIWNCIGALDLLYQGNSQTVMDKCKDFFIKLNQKDW